MPILPRRLEPGDTIGIIAPASAPPEPDAIDRSVEAVRKLGFKPVLSRNVRKRHGFLAGTDRERAADLMAMFTSEKVKTILCIRGGYGTSRLLGLLDYEAISKHPKIIVGYSDLTSLHCALLVKSKLVTFHGPMLNSDFIQPGFPSFTVECWKRTVMNPAPAGSISAGASNERQPAIILKRGVATGRLVGGNLTLLCSALATPYFPNVSGAILFFEDLDEKPYRIDRMLTQLLNAGVLQNVEGIAIGVNKGCEDKSINKRSEYRQSLEDVLEERLAPLKVPIVINLPFGHVALNATIPLGVRATLDAKQGDLIIEEAAVK